MNTRTQIINIYASINTATCSKYIQCNSAQCNPSDTYIQWKRCIFTGTSSHYVRYMYIPVLAVPDCRPRDLLHCPSTPSFAWCHRNFCFAFSAPFYLWLPMLPTLALFDLLENPRHQSTLVLHIYKGRNERMVRVRGVWKCPLASHWSHNHKSVTVQAVLPSIIHITVSMSISSVTQHKTTIYSTDTHRTCHVCSNPPYGR